MDGINDLMVSIAHVLEHVLPAHKNNNKMREAPPFSFPRCCGDCTHLSVSSIVSLPNFCLLVSVYDPPGGSMAVQRNSEKPLVRAQTAPESSQDGPTTLVAKHSRRRQKGRLHSVTDIAIPLPQVESPTTLSNPTPTSKDKSPNPRGARSDSAPFHEQGNWAQVASDFEEHDEKLVKKWNDQIDTLLVFAGLFSAVVTAFNVESYRQLRLDADEASRDLLVTISHQLGNLPQMLQSMSPSNATAEVLSHLEAFEPATADVWINGLWFSSLVCSLIAASLGILVKQWLQRYKTEDYSMARERTRIRQHRFEGLETWSVPHIVAFLPLLLRTSLNLFFIGLIVFLRRLHLPIAIAISLLISLWFLLYFASLLLPSIYSDCPYKSPEATAFYIARRVLRDGWRATAKGWNFISWTDGEESIKRDSSRDAVALATVDKTFGDRCLDFVLRGCLKDLGKDQVLVCVRRIISNRLHTNVGLISSWMSLDTSRITRRCSEALINILLDAFERLEARDMAAVSLHNTAEWIKEALSCILYLLDCIDWGTEATSYDDRLMVIFPKLMEITSPFAALASRVEHQIVIILSNRPGSRFVHAASALPKLFAAASVLLTRLDDTILGVKVTATMLSLTTFIKLEALKSPQLLLLIKACDFTLSTFDLPPGTSGSSRQEIRERLNTCRNKVQELEIRSPGITGNLLSTVEVCMVRADTAPVTQDGDSQ